MGSIDRRRLTRMEGQSDMDSWILNLKRVTGLVMALNGMRRDGSD